MSRVDVKTKDTILMLKNQINIKRQNIDWEYIEGYIKRQLQETYEDGHEEGYYEGYDDTIEGLDM